MLSCAQGESWWFRHITIGSWRFRRRPPGALHCSWPSPQSSVHRISEGAAASGREVDVHRSPPRGISFDTLNFLISNPCRPSPDFTTSRTRSPWTTSTEAANEIPLGDHFDHARAVAVRGVLSVDAARPDPIATPPSAPRPERRSCDCIRVDALEHTIGEVRASRASTVPAEKSECPEYRAGNVFQGLRRITGTRNLDETRKPWLSVVQSMRYFADSNSARAG